MALLMAKEKQTFRKCYSVIDRVLENQYHLSILYEFCQDGQMAASTKGCRYLLIR